MKKYLAYLPAILVIIIFLIGMSACDNRIGKPDIRNEFIKDKKPNYFGWKWNFKW